MIRLELINRFNLFNIADKSTDCFLKDCELAVEIFVFGHQALLDAKVNELEAQAQCNQGPRLEDLCHGYKSTMSHLRRE